MITMKFDDSGMRRKHKELEKLPRRIEEELNKNGGDIEEISSRFLRELDRTGRLPNPKGNSGGRR